MTAKYKVRHGGLMRRCLATLRERMPLCADDPIEGGRLKCLYCDCMMVFKNDAWEWDSPHMPWER